MQNCWKGVQLFYQMVKWMVWKTRVVGGLHKIKLLINVCETCNKNMNLCVRKGVIIFYMFKFDDYRVKMKQLIKKEKWFGKYKEGPYKFINKEMKTFWNNDKGTCLNFILF